METLHTEGKELVMSEQNKLAAYEDRMTQTAKAYGLTGAEVDAYKKAAFLSTQEFIPKDYQGKAANCYLAMEIAEEMGVKPREIMNSMYMVHGRPGWYAEALVRFLKIKTGLQIKYEEDHGKMQVRAYAGGTKPVYGDWVSMEMARQEGWTKNPKYKSMPMYMLKKRAATFFIRTHFPEVIMGYQTADEIIDIEASESTVKAKRPEQPKLAAKYDKLK